MLDRNRSLSLRFVPLLLAGVILLACFAVVMQPLEPMKSSYVPPVDAGRLKQHVIKLSREFYPRNVAHARNLEAAAAYIRGELGLLVRKRRR